MTKLFAAALVLLCIAAPAFAGDVNSPLPHKTTLKPASVCNTPQGKYKKECAPTPHH